jgi:formylglycine-generating enzyme required for sulfatase activity
MNQLPEHIFPFQQFIAHLKHFGFTVTIDHHIRLQKLIQCASGENTFGLFKADKLDQLKFEICPIFATTEDQQQLFYQEYDRFFSVLQSKPQSQLKPKEKAPETQTDIPKTKKWPYVISGLFILFVLTFSLITFIPKEEVPQPEIQEKVASPERTREDQVVDIPPVQSVPVSESITKIRQQPTQVSKSVTKVTQETSVKTSVTDWRNTRIPRYLILLSLALAILLSELYRYNHRKMVLQKQRKKKPPMNWPIKVPPQKPAYLKNRLFYTIVRRLRNRLQSDVLKLDIQETINKSIKTSGFPDPQYSPMTRPPEYLFLIDLPGFRDHYAGYAAQFADTLLNEGLFVDRYFYTDDPQICFKHIQDRRLLLDDLFRKYPDHRLIVVGTGDDFFDPLTGKIEPWIETFYHWPERSLLTTRPVSEWGINEAILSHHFPVFPATMDGINHLALHFDWFEKQSKRPFEKSSPLLELPDAADIKALQQTLKDDHLFQWVCACAVYPELHWNLTLYLGAVILKEPVKESQLFRLIHLPWFKNGNIPDEWRLQLISNLSKENKARTHHAIIDLLEKNPPPKESQAEDIYRLNLTVHRWMLHPKDRKRRKEVQKTIFQDQQLAQDRTIIRLLDSAPKSPLDIVLPSYLRQLFFQNAMPLFGVKSGIRLMTAFCISLLLVLLAVLPDMSQFFYPPKQPIFSLEKTSIEINESVRLIAVNSAARKREPLNVLWDNNPQFAIPPDNDSDYFQWTFNPFESSLPKTALTAGAYTIIAGFTTYTWSDPFTITILEARAPPEKPVEKPQKQIISSGRLFIDVIPETAKIQLLHMKKPYQRGMNLNEGFYRVEVSHENHVTQTKQISIQGGEDLYETIQLEPFGQLFVKANPEDARVRIMNIKPKYQEGIFLAPGRYHIEVSKDGFDTYLEWISLEAGEEKTVSVNLNASKATPTVTVDSADAITDVKLSNQPAKIKKTKEKQFQNSIGMTFVLIPAGSFMMGSPENEPGRINNEKQHRVTITQDYYMQTTEVTQGQWKAVMGSNPSYNKDCGDDCPVENVSWNDVQSFMKKLNSMDSGYSYRLPTEAEWEYAARAGTTTPFAFGNCLSTDDENYDGNYPLTGCAKGQYRRKTISVGSLRKNPWGLYDMHGNVYEWCQDWYGQYPTGSVTNPTGPTTGSGRVIRGGSWLYYARSCRSADRDSYGPDDADVNLGFRLCAPGR